MTNEMTSEKRVANKYDQINEFIAYDVLKALIASDIITKNQAIEIYIIDRIKYSKKQGKDYYESMRNICQKFDADYSNINRYLDDRSVCRCGGNGERARKWVVRSDDVNEIVRSDEPRSSEVTIQNNKNYDLRSSEVTIPTTSKSLKKEYIDKEEERRSETSFETSCFLTQDSLQEEKSVKDIINNHQVNNPQDFIDLFNKILTYKQIKLPKPSQYDIPTALTILNIAGTNLKKYLEDYVKQKIFKNCPTQNTYIRFFRDFCVEKNHKSIKDKQLEEYIRIENQKEVEKNYLLSDEYRKKCEENEEKRKELKRKFDKRKVLIAEYLDKCDKGEIKLDTYEDCYNILCKIGKSLNHEYYEPSKEIKLALDRMINDVLAGKIVFSEIVKYLIRYNEITCEITMSDIWIC